MESRYLSTHKEITKDLYLAFVNDATNCVAVVKKNLNGKDELLTPAIFSPFFFEEFFFDNRVYYHLHCSVETGGKQDEIGSYIFLADFSQSVRLELCLDSISAEKSGMLKGRVGSLDFYGYIYCDSYYRVMAIIPVKYKKIIKGEELYIAANDGNSWDIYDYTHFVRSEIYYRDLEHGDVDDKYSKSDYYCSLEQTYKETIPRFKEYQLFLFRILKGGIATISQTLDEPYPITEDGKIDLIGCRVNDCLYDSVIHGPFREFFQLECRYTYIVSRDGKKGLWKKKEVSRKETRIDRGFWPMEKAEYYGYGEEVLPCVYKEIVPNIEECLDYQKRDILGSCNSFSILCESGWGVYDSQNNRTILPPVFDEPATVIIGPLGYIAQHNGRFGIVDNVGGLVLPFIYDRITITKIEFTKLYDEDGVRGWSITTDIEYALAEDTFHRSFVFEWA